MNLRTLLHDMLEYLGPDEEPVAERDHTCGGPDAACDGECMDAAYASRRNVLRKRIQQALAMLDRAATEELGRRSFGMAIPVPADAIEQGVTQAEMLSRGFVHLHMDPPEPHVLDGNEPETPFFQLDVPYIIERGSMEGNALFLLRQFGPSTTEMIAKKLWIQSGEIDMREPTEKVLQNLIAEGSIERLEHEGQTWWRANFS